MAIRKAEQFKGLNAPEGYFRIVDLVWHLSESDQGWLSIIGFYANAEQAAPKVEYRPVPDSMLIGADGVQLKGEVREAEILRIQKQPSWPKTHSYPEPLRTFNGPRVKDKPDTHPRKLVYQALMQEWKDAGAVAVSAEGVIGEP